MLMNAEIGTMFGPSREDINRVTKWLTDKGFAVHQASPDESTMELDGTVSQVSRAFRTSIHNLSINGEAHFANISDPQIPAALAPVVAGIASLNDFMPHRMAHRVSSEGAEGSIPSGIRPTGTNYLSAADLATIYNFNPLFQAGITGNGQTIVLIENTDPYSVGTGRCSARYSV